MIFRIHHLHPICQILETTYSVNDDNKPSTRILLTNSQKTHSHHCKTIKLFASLKIK